MADTPSAAPPADAEATCDAVMDRIGSAAVVDRAVLETILTAVLARGHVLVEDVPGTGKTVTARLLAEALGLGFNRVQFTPDLLPSDITGSNVYDEHEGEFRFSEGPVFTNVVLADEINRAPPKTQAALLEAMEEGQVSVDGETYDLPDPFLVVATQNPVEQEGTFRLPEAQRDRFIVKTSLGYATVEGEMELLDRRAGRRTLAPSVEAVADAGAVLALQEAAEEVRVEEKVRRYIVELARATRTDARTKVGVSPRGIQRVFEAARARAVIVGREYVTPDDVKAIAEPTMAHRLILTTESSVEGVNARRIVQDVLDRVDVPGVAPEDGSAATERTGQRDDRGPPTQPTRGTRQGDVGTRNPDGGRSQRVQDSRGDRGQSARESGRQPRDGQPRNQQGRQPTDQQGGQPRKQQCRQPTDQQGGQPGGGGTRDEAAERSTSEGVPDGESRGEEGVGDDDRDDDREAGRDDDRDDRR